MCVLVVLDTPLFMNNVCKYSLGIFVSQLVLLKESNKGLIVVVVKATTIVNGGA